MLLLYTLMVHAVSPSTPAVVKTFYNSMIGLSCATNDSEAYDYRESIMKCFRGKENSGIPIPNDFYNWGYNKETKIPSNQYALRFEELSYKQKQLHLEYSEGISLYISEVDLKQYKNQSSGLIQTVIKKTLSDGKISKTFSDTLIIERNEIVIFKNSIFNDDGEDIESLRVLAASYYTSKKYYSAYKAYEKIIKIDPNNANAYYRLGLMTYWKQGCWFSTKEAHRKGLEYAKKSRCLGFDKADTAIYYMIHPQII